MITRGMDENEVSRAVVAWLEGKGYVARALIAGEHGIDIAAWHPKTGHRWAIEAKGSTSSKEWTKRYDRQNSRASEGAAFNGVSKAFLQTVCWTRINEFTSNTSIGIAAPNDKWFYKWLKNIEPACDMLGIAHFKIGDNGAVETFPEDLDQAPRLERPHSLSANPGKMPDTLRRNFKAPLPPYPTDSD